MHSVLTLKSGMDDSNLTSRIIKATRPLKHTGGFLFSVQILGEGAASVFQHYVNTDYMR